MVDATMNPPGLMESALHPPAGLWRPTQLQAFYYGPGIVEKKLLEVLPSKQSKAFIVTTSSLISKTGLISDLEKQLGPHFVGTFGKIGQHAPVADLDRATEAVLKDSSIDTVISVGGGSPIDSAKAISYRSHERAGKWLHHIAIPTTLGAAECTMIAGFTNNDGNKTGVRAQEIVPQVLFYDADFALETPTWLFMSTGLRALDHAVELMYNPNTSEVPTKKMAISAATDLFTYLPKYKADPKDVETITMLQLAAYASLGFLGLNLKGGVGLSHAMGYALGSPYNIPHGITSCLTLGHVVKLKAHLSKEDASQIARMASAAGVARSGDDEKDADAIGQAILDLVEKLGLRKSLKADYNVGVDQHPVIAKKATGQESGPLYDGVYKIVENI